ncbi:hypothetical protein [Brasilonema sp. UFV-L1]|uniref:hypothetical protein n=1 Tax=Brasilonema sp. UFV-L1 TaxID=2234130 RepID=UPI00145D4E0C|nr:hypothetical protein [Brasilonema sp. UFV-L1]NMG10351.1 hypothetical protein [Brasilonema sp. UFV-L1]
MSLRNVICIVVGSISFTLISIAAVLGLQIVLVPMSEPNLTLMQYGAVFSFACGITTAAFLLEIPQD